MSAPTGESADEASVDRLVLPSASHVWRSNHGVLLICACGVLGAVGWWLDEGALLGPVVLLVLAVGAWPTAIALFAREEGAERVVLTSKGITVERRGKVVETTEWAHMKYVEFDSGDRLTNWARNGGYNNATVTCFDDRPYDRWNPTPIGASSGLPVFGRRGLVAIDETLRSACASHGVEYRSYWSWGWRVSIHRSNWRHPDPKPPRRPW